MLKNVFALGFTQDARYMYRPLIEKLYGSIKLSWIQNASEMRQIAHAVDSVCVNLFSLGYDIAKEIATIRNVIGKAQIVCIGTFHVGHYVGKTLVEGGADIIYANIENDTEYSNMVFALQNNLKYYPKNIREFINSRDTYPIPSLFKLSPKETLNLQMSCEGMSSKEIARIMNVKLCTVSTMRRNTMRKTGFPNWEKVVCYGLICKFTKGGA